MDNRVVFICYCFMSKLLLPCVSIRYSLMSENAIDSCHDMLLLCVKLWLCKPYVY